MGGDGDLVSHDELRKVSTAGILDCDVLLSGGGLQVGGKEAALALVHLCRWAVGDADQWVLTERYAESLVCGYILNNVSAVMRSNIEYLLESETSRQSCRRGRCSPGQGGEGIRSCSGSLLARRRFVVLSG